MKDEDINEIMLEIHNQQGRVLRVKRVGALESSVIQHALARGSQGFAGTTCFWTIFFMHQHVFQQDFLVLVELQEASIYEWRIN